VPTNDSRLELRIPTQLKDWVAEYARARHTTVSALIVRFITRLMEEEKKKKSEDVEQI
jgi:hypothetical protein